MTLESGQAKTKFFSCSESHSCYRMTNILTWYCMLTPQLTILRYSKQLERNLIKKVSCSTFWFGNWKLMHEPYGRKFLWVSYYHSIPNNHTLTKNKTSKNFNYYLEHQQKWSNYKNYNLLIFTIPLYLKKSTNFWLSIIRII